MNHNEETFATWNKIADLYQEKFMDLDLYDSTYDAFCDLVTTQSASILELGCGPGNITRYLQKVRPDFKILGTDVAPNMLELARKNVPTARFEEMDAREIGTLKQSFDGIVCGFCLPYISSSEAKKFIVDSHKALNERGAIYLSFVAGDESLSGYKTGSSGDRIYFHFHPLESVLSSLKNAGFENLATTHVEYSKTEKGTDIHTIIIGTK